MEKDPWIKRFREMDKRSISGSIRYDVISRYRSICVACGARSTEARLHVDHIVPVSHGGRSEPNNLQVLCYKCNTEKRDRDERNFLLEHNKLKFRKSGCRFCEDKAVYESNRMAYALRGDDASGSGHMVVPFRHVSSFMELIPAEKQLCMALIESVADRMRREESSAEIRIDGLDGIHDGHCRIAVNKAS